jgi:LPXTG-motif cell wall-anchored protein
MQALTKRRGASISLALLLSFVAVSPGFANQTQNEQDMVILNPGGGVLANGSDGIRMSFNSSSNPSVGSDQVWFTNEENWCCNGGGPVLAIGSAAFGEAGAASNENLDSFDSLAISGVTGANQRAAAGTDPDFTADTGNATATLTYTKVVDGLTYTLARAITYTFPNNYYDETWTVTIPLGNTAVVKLFVGGDTAPGGSDTGNGKLRTVNGLKLIYSSNPDSGQYLGYSESNAGSAWTQYFVGDYNSPYPTIAAGGNLDNSILEGNHDAGLQVQWTFPTAAGSYAKTMRTTIGYNSDIGGSPAAAPGFLDLDLALDASAGEIVPGGEVILQGSGLLAYSPLELVLRSTPVTIDLAGQTANASGAFYIRAKLPDSISAGVHSLTLTGTKPDGNPISDVLYFEIDADGKLLNVRAGLARTGMEFSSLPLLAGSVLIALGAAVVAYRRRKGISEN